MEKKYDLLKYQISFSRVKCKSVLKEPILIKQGVQQGSNVSPLLF